MDRLKGMDNFDISKKFICTSACQPTSWCCLCVIKCFSHLYVNDTSECHPPPLLPLPISDFSHAYKFLSTPRFKTTKQTRVKGLNEKIWSVSLSDVTISFFLASYESKRYFPIARLIGIILNSLWPIIDNRGGWWEAARQHPQNPAHVPPPHHHQRCMYETNTESRK